MDVVRNIYEGGGTRWESQRLLIDYIRELNMPSPENKETRTRSAFYRAQVLELGCGQGDAALVVAAANPKLLVCQDLNLEVITALEGRFKAKKKEEIGPQTSCHSLVKLEGTGADETYLWGGSWNHMLATKLAHLPHTKFSHVIASEILYRPPYYPTILALLAMTLQPESGLGIFASKRIYFGVEESGGGTAGWRSFLNDWNVKEIEDRRALMNQISVSLRSLAYGGRFYIRHEIAKEEDTGHSNILEILCMRIKKRPKRADFDQHEISHKEIILLESLRAKGSAPTLRAIFPCSTPRMVSPAGRPPWTLAMAINAAEEQAGAPVSAIIRLNRDKSLYSWAGLAKKGIVGFHHPCHGGKIGVTPRDCQIVGSILNYVGFHRPNSVVIVHCTHGRNRTGRALVYYLARTFGLTEGAAQELFEKQRGMPIESRNYPWSIASDASAPLAPSAVLQSTSLWGEDVATTPEAVIGLIDSAL